MNDGASNSKRPGRRVFPNEGESKRRQILRRLGVITGLGFLGGTSTLLEGCGGGGDDSSGPNPMLGAHTLEFARNGQGVDPTSTQSVNTRASGSTILTSIGRGIISQHVLPTDNKGNTYALREGPHNYPPKWPTSGTALYTSASASGGTGHVVSTTNPNFDEITVAVVEILNGGRIQDVQWNYPLAAPLTSLSVTTTGPATLVAFWWGDSVVALQTAVPDNNFTVIDSVLDNLPIVQCAVAVKNVSAAGQYNVTWTATPAQGAQLYLIAVQKA